jgi:hypothetical protein
LPLTVTPFTDPLGSSERVATLTNAIEEKPVFASARPSRGCGRIYLRRKRRLRERTSHAARTVSPG